MNVSSIILSTLVPAEATNTKHQPEPLLLKRAYPPYPLFAGGYTAADTNRAAGFPPLGPRHISDKVNLLKFRSIAKQSLTIAVYQTKLLFPLDQSLQEMAAALVHSLRSCGTLLLLIVTVWFGYSMVGVELFGGRFYSCRSEDARRSVTHRKRTDTDIAGKSN